MFSSENIIEEEGMNSRVFQRCGGVSSCWITPLGSVQVVGFFDVAARLCSGDGPIAALVGGSSCSIGSALQRRTFNDYEIISPYRLLTNTKERKYDGAVQ